MLRGAEEEDLEVEKRYEAIFILPWQDFFN